MTLSWTPRRIWLVGEEPEPAFDWFSQEDPVGVKCRWNRGWAGSHAPIAGVLWVDRLSQIRCTSSRRARSVSICGEELVELRRAVPAMDGWMTRPVATSSAANRSVVPARE